MNYCQSGDGEFATAISPLEKGENKEMEMPTMKGERVKIPRQDEFGVRNPRKLLDPQLPTEKEVEEHNLTHLPDRNWCPHCVAGKG